MVALMDRSRIEALGAASAGTQSLAVIFLAASKHKSYVKPTKPASVEFLGSPLGSDGYILRHQSSREVPDARFWSTIRNTSDPSSYGNLISLGNCPLVSKNEEVHMSYSTRRGAPP